MKMKRKRKRKLETTIVLSKSKSKIQQIRSWARYTSLYWLMFGTIIFNQNALYVDALMTL